MFFNEKGEKYEKERSEMLRMLHKKIKKTDDWFLIYFFIYNFCSFCRESFPKVLSQKDFRK